MKILVFLVFTCPLFAEENVKIIYKYKKYEKIDLGDLSVKGKLMTPGDLSVKKDKRNKFHENLYHRKNFDKEIIEDQKDIR